MCPSCKRGEENRRGLEEVTQVLFFWGMGQIFWDWFGSIVGVIETEGRRGEGFGEDLERTRNVHWRKTEPTVNYVTVCMYVCMVMIYGT